MRIYFVIGFPIALLSLRQEKSSGIEIGEFIGRNLRGFQFISLRRSLSFSKPCQSADNKVLNIESILHNELSESEKVNQI